MRHRRWFHALLWLTLALCLSAPTAQAKGPPDKATLAGPGIPGAIEITDPADLNLLSFYAFEQVEVNNRAGLTPPTNPGAAFLLTRMIRQQDGSFRPWDELHYYPQAGRPGLVYLDGIIGESSSEFDGKWYAASVDGDAALRRVLERVGALPPVTLPNAGRTPAWPAILMGAGLLVLVGAALRRRTRALQLG